MAKTITHKDEADETSPAIFGEKDHLEISQEKTFSQMVFELLSERESEPRELKLFDLILNLSIDHGPNTPSAVKVIEEAKKGESMSEALSEGIEEIGDAHGGAARPLMKELYRIKNQEINAQGLVEEYLKNGKKMPGFGHRVYKDTDPRAQLIFQNMGEKTEFIDLLKEIKDELKTQSGKDLPINIDGAIAAALCSFGFDPELGIAVFLIARTPGLIGQYLNNHA